MSFFTAIMKYIKIILKKHMIYFNVYRIFLRSKMSIKYLLSKNNTNTVSM